MRIRGVSLRRITDRFRITLVDHGEREINARKQLSFYNISASSCFLDLDRS